MAAKTASLQAYGAIVIDEAHQHPVASRLLPGLPKELALKQKDDFQIIVSANIDADLFLKFFPGPMSETVSGKKHNVLVSYLAELPDECHRGDHLAGASDRMFETCLDVFTFLCSTGFQVFETSPFNYIVDDCLVASYIKVLLEVLTMQVQLPYGLTLSQLSLHVAIASHRSP